MDVDLKGRTAVVTGSSKGIGYAIAEALAGAGANVVLSARDEGEVRAAAERLDGRGGGAAIGVACDVRRHDDVRRMIRAAVDRFGGLDVLVNNAGVFLAHPVTATSYEQWQQLWRHTLDLNLVAAANATWCAVRHMSAGARIINVSSRGAFRGEPDSPAYGASKAGLNALSQSLAVALAPHGIAVTAVAPGFVETDMTNEHLKPPRGDEIRTQSPFGRVARPEEIAEAVLWLASPAAEWASGTIIDLNGASYLR